MVRTPEELARSNATRLLGVFADGHVPYEIDRRFQGLGVPSLKEMVQAALPRLAAHRGASSFRWKRGGLTTPTI